MPGWIDNVNGASGIVLSAFLGILRTIKWNYYAKTDFVPVDKVANAMIAVAWAIGTEYNVENPKIFNITTTNDNTITLGKIYDTFYENALESPFMCTFRPFTRLVPMQTGPHPILNPLKNFVSQYLFAYVFDLIMILFGKKKIMVKLTVKVDKTMDLMQFLIQIEWKFRSDNLMALNNRLDDEDKKQFDFDMSVLDWQLYIKNCHYGNRRYLLKETDDSIPMAVRRLKLIHIAYTMLKMSMIFIIVFAIIYTYY